jgi:hypothetical protein
MEYEPFFHIIMTGFDVEFHPDVKNLPVVDNIRKAFSELQLPLKDVTISSDNHAFVLFESLQRVGS